MGVDIIELFSRPAKDPVMASSFPMMNSGWTVTVILVVYLAFVLKLGRIFMQNRNPYNIKNVMLVYNVLQVIYNVILFLYGLDMILINPVYNIRCIEVLPLDHPFKPTERTLAYLYFLNKVIDLLDTVFFVLRKSYKQITFLHVYHHVLMVSSTYWILRIYGGSGQFHVMGTLNTFVHSVMYSYYFISALSPGLKSSLWWKRYITEIQLIQFVIILAQSLIVLIFNPSCQFPIFLQYVQLTQATVMIILFGKFYINSYIKPKSKKSQ
ncbi:PREDICTED: elongation of very long chain fatty acids protein 1-like [Drosophila arizonae]|uniref:Elongation of very long chain fatty acids protein n=1 Tax=Drosophila arizonae TaxID=7263 RepID=A0ABM1PBM1_DROAR|nr:PREDICTED: elongation of very long chain fatty acids protein 1-like [Drosophila arizonae]